MRMSIDKAINHGKEQLEIFGGDHKEFIETSIAIMLEVLTELKMKIEELPMYYDPIDIGDLIQEKINTLRGKKDEKCN